MKKAIKAALLSIFVISLLGGCSENITESSVHQLMAKMEKAVDARDADRLARYLSDDIDIELTVDMLGEKQVFTPSKAEHTQMMHDTWQSMTSYEHTSSDLRIDLRGSSAVVSVNLEESITMKNGLSLSSSGSQIMTVEYVGNRLMVTKIVAETIMKF